MTRTHETTERSAPRGRRGLPPRRRPARRRGSSFIEILVALAILSLLMVGLLQMFSLALMTNMGAATRTDLTYKCQQVVENLRMIYWYTRQSPPNNTLATAAGVPTPLAVTPSPKYLPYTASDTSTTLTWTYWGPDGVGCVGPDDDGRDPPYKLGYLVEDGGTFWRITATAVPIDSPLVTTGPTASTNSGKYWGNASRLKRVDYVAQIPKG